MRIQRIVALLLMLAVMFIFGASAFANDNANEVLYKKLSALIQKSDTELIQKLNRNSRDLNWENGEACKFQGHLRLLDSGQTGKSLDETQIYLIRRSDGEIFILSIPDRQHPNYNDLAKVMTSKMAFNIKVRSLAVEGQKYQFAQFIDKPIQPMVHKVFKTMIVSMLFLIMAGMGLTLTIKDFTILFIKPKAILIGETLQFGVLPLIAVGLGYLMGFHANYPFIFVGMVLITATPGGVTSNLMTHYAKGDVALSISLTSISTVLSIIFLPLLLSAYCANIPDIEVPTAIVARTVIVLVLIPLIVGMVVRRINEKFAERLIPFFNKLGMVALFILIFAGVMGNMEVFGDTDRYGIMFYSMVLLLTSLGMLFGAVIPKILGMSNFQTKAISLETGLRSVTLSMSIALLIQDSMGDFHSSMFFVGGAFGVFMYVAGLVAIKAYPVLLPEKGDKNL